MLFIPCLFQKGLKLTLKSYEYEKLILYWALEANNTRTSSQKITEGGQQCVRLASQIKAMF